jgi:hypothetical protein
MVGRDARHASLRLRAVSRHVLALASGTPALDLNKDYLQGVSAPNASNGFPVVWDAICALNRLQSIIMH